MMIEDTVNECNRRGQIPGKYISGFKRFKSKPHFPVPAIPVRVVWAMAPYIHQEGGYVEQWLLVGERMEEDQLLAWSEM